MPGGDERRKRSRNRPAERGAPSGVVEVGELVGVRIFLSRGWVWASGVRGMRGLSESGTRNVALRRIFLSFVEEGVN